MPSGEKIRVLMVDDDPGVLEALEFEYGRKYYLTLADGIGAVKRLILKDNKVFDVAVIDMWFGRDQEGGLRLIKWLKKHDPLLECIVLTGHPEIHNVVDCMKAGAYNYVVKGMNDTSEKLSFAIEEAYNSLPLIKIIYDTLHTTKNYFEKMAYRDPFYVGHGERVSAWSRLLADKLNLRKKDKDYLEFAALFHDVGKEKLGVSFKPGGLTRDEAKRMRKYPVYGHDMLKEVFASIDLQPIAILDAVLYHRRNWDGSGFPELDPEREREMIGEKIPLLSRIIAVACEFDHGFIQRNQRFLRDPEQAKQHLQNISGHRLDPDIVKVFLEAYEQGQITRDYPYRWREEEFGRIRMLVDNEQFEEARMAGDKWAREIDQAPEFDCVRAAAYVGLGDLLAPIPSQREQALGYYTDAVRLHPAYAEAYYKRGCCYLKQNCWQEAERDFDVATAIIPTYLEAHLERAAIFLKNSRYMKAQQLYSRVLALDHDPVTKEDNVQALLGQANVFLYQKKFSEALGSLNRAEDNVNEFLEKEDITETDRQKYEFFLVQTLLIKTRVFLFQQKFIEAHGYLKKAGDKITKFLKQEDITEEDKKEYDSLLNEQKRLVEEMEAMQNPPVSKASKGKKTAGKV